MTDPNDFWAPLRTSTQARIGLGRAGDGLPTRRVLEFRAAHAAARDAVHQPLDVEALSAEVRPLGLGEPAVVRSQVTSRSEYLRRPDLGRVPANLDGLTHVGADVGIVLADGLSPRALHDHGAALLGALVTTLGERYTIAPPTIATSARVALSDHIGAALGVNIVVVIIGERPGLSVADSLGIYLTYDPRPGRADSERNCISNIHPPDGLGYTEAARIVLSLIGGARELGKTGVELKDTTPRGELTGS
ncbi:ethanolamine ammonia-lyase subunit EutC [Hoyosella rhizosphaerae]|uniref:Ethanolamine ammonia-lyase small subunit n=1 Tax=Hoyosella rhizosphaerae TaxID=1755582 RepID=A0A916UHX0_9ACTN|nr:ethanolamine ammonia-lyase subunit EutC [Hoyosella rhizosphaerae]MBN4928304.1 ethanolamine ammonia-lyase subunit EutC [Hoyosella rhizosphaerae]GGC73936.1 ethanolamine ammonia-lyase light chain [Hoyosella rhizosphaerae]